MISVSTYRHLRMFVEVAVFALLTVAALAQGLAPVPGTRLRIVPGVAQRGDFPDVMRGEETQIVGALTAAPDLADAVVVLPGTHSKWMTVEHGRLSRFATAMTGEVYGLLRRESILARSQPDNYLRAVPG